MEIIRESFEYDGKHSSRNDTKGNVSMAVHKDIEFVYGWNRYTMGMMGIWPEERKWNQLSSYKALAPILTMVLFVCLPQTMNLRFIWGDLDLIIENIMMGNITITISVLKTVAFWLNGRSLKSLLNSMENDWRELNSQRDRDTMLGIAKISRAMSIKSTVLCQGVVTAYVLLHYLSVRHGGLQLLFRAYFPFDFERTPIFQLIFLGQLVAALYAATTYTTVDTFVGMLVLHVCGQLSTLHQELRTLRGRNKSEFQRKLGYIVKKHEYLNRFAETIEGCFNVMLLAQMLGCTVQFCFQWFQAITSFNGKTNDVLIFRLIFLLMYVVYVMLQLYLYCYVGERLLVESTKMAHAAYDCEWYNLSVEEAKMLIMIIHRAKTPMRITAGKFCSFNLELFSEVLKRSMGYFSVLYAVKNKASD